ncbi:very short patch repair endonuclease [Flavobacterium sp. WV_118_3]|uniref:very short patch repair endonuclease n=1 Tax=Flavobacterium sp. WV_118_3 TaxID=3151764 RepID=UPI00321BEC79
MSRIKGKNTKPELLVRKYLFSEGFRYRLHDKKLPGKPDVILPKYKTVIFVNGCFWHGHEECKFYVIPKTRTDWWLAKINTTIANDEKVTTTLQNLGWSVITIWECELKKEKAENTLSELIKKIIN